VKLGQVIILQKINLYRRRFIPDEKILLSDDILRVDSDVIITKWNTTLNTKKNFSSGRSCVFIKEGFKVSKLYDEDKRFLFYYCDIVNVVIDKNNYVVEDLLADVIIESDGKVRVLDLDEIAQAMDLNLITVEMAKDALRKTNRLLNLIYNNIFYKFTDF
jgi:Uncharacterized conserved protein